MKILIVGGAGYIGSITAQTLLEAAADVTIYDNLSTGHRAAVTGGVSLVKGDLRDEESIRRALQKEPFDAVMHFAGLIQAGESMERPGLYFANNISYVITLLNEMLEHRVTRFVFSSSAAVYGNPDSVPIDESAGTCPTNPYGESKLAVERLLRWYGERCGLRYACLRYFNAAGAAYGLGEDHHPETHLIPLAIQSALGLRDELTIYGSDYPTPDGTCIRDYVHVLDLARAHVQALDYLERGNMTCNLGSEHGCSVREVVDAVQRVSGAKVPVKDGPRRAGDPAALVASSRLAREALGWKPEHGSLEEIVESAWEWRRNNPKGYQDI